MTAVARRPDDRVAWASTPHPVQRWLSTWGRLSALVIAGIAQLAGLVLALTWLRAWAPTVIGLHVVLVSAAVLVIINSRMETTYKLAWAIPVCLFPLVGALFYLLYGNRQLGRARRARLEETKERASDALRLLPDAQTPLPAGDIQRQVTYLSNAGGFRPFDSTHTTYYPLGELGFDAMVAAIGRARRYVLAEYFIIESGEMWERLFAALAAKAAEGVDVRLLYDDLGSFFTLPLDLRNRCEAAGIKVVAVNPLSFGFTLSFQNRDHRKILAVDGAVAFTGGINIADEYINAIDKIGHWKDTVLRLEGPGAWGLTVLFLQLWDMLGDGEVDYTEFVPDAARLPTSGAGVVVPFDDSPFSDTSVGEQAYRHLMQSARHSVDIFTPYLVVSDSLVRELRATAKAGIRVRIVVPHREDKWYVHLVTRSFYGVLLEAGVEVYEYTPGFIHAKSMLVDDTFGLVGTINFDFRSFFLHQECGVWMHRTAALEAMRADVDATLAVSQPVTLEEMRSAGPFRRLGKAVLRTFAPAM